MNFNRWWRLKDIRFDVTEKSILNLNKIKILTEVGGSYESFYKSTHEK